MVARLKPKEEAPEFLARAASKIPDKPKEKPQPAKPKSKEIVAVDKAEKPAKSTAEEKRKEAARKERAELHRKKMFISAYLNKPNATKAALLAGYAEKNAPAQGALLLKDPYVAEKISSALTRMQERTEITLEKVIRELAKLGMSNMQDYTSINAYGEPQIDLSDLDPDQFAAIQEVQTETYMEGHGDDAVPVKRVKIKLYSKTDALDKLARILGAYKGKGGGDLDGGDAPQVTNYTLQIGNANIVVQSSTPGQGGGTQGTGAEVLTLP